MITLPAAEWSDRAARHGQRVDALVGPYLDRRAKGEKHPVLDFLFTYYGHRPTHLRRWHPGYGVALADAAEYADLRGYHILEASTVTVDPDFLQKRSGTLDFIINLLRSTASRPAHLSCFGLHEWAMVYRTEEVRHDSVPLRLGPAGTDAVVESMSLRCTHYDAYRFFTPQAVGRNARPLSRENQIHDEQPGCLHAAMDIYKWGYKLAPLVASDLLLECFTLACEARELDMRASPYDLTAYGYTPVPIETPAGRAEYVRAQTRLTERAATLRRHLLTTCEHLAIPTSRGS